MRSLGAFLALLLLPACMASNGPQFSASSVPSAIPPAASPASTVTTPTPAQPANQLNAVVTLDQATEARLLGLSSGSFTPRVAPTPASTPTYTPPARPQLARVVPQSQPRPAVTRPRPSTSGRTPIRASYTGTCDCPYDRMRNGRRCGGNSAYSRPGGWAPACYR